MSTAQVGVILRHLRRLTSTHGDEQQPDRQLLERFARHRDDDAFAALLRRHGPMVLGVCRSVLHDLHDAEDAFQAAFLVLAQKAGSIHQHESLGSWLYRVAYHVAVKAQAGAARRRARERTTEPPPGADPLLDLSLRELRGVLYEELGRLPEYYRAPLVLCYLEEKTLEEAARLLGWSRGAVKGRLERGRERLRSRLARRGLALSAGLTVAGLAGSSASAKVPALLANATLEAAVLLTAGHRTAAAVTSTAVATLIEGATQTMFSSKRQVLTLVVLAVFGAVAGLGLLTHRALATRPPDAAQAEPPLLASGEQAPQAEPPRADDKEIVAVQGRVLDPDGKPLPGAKLYLNTFNPKEPTYPVRATSGADGRFDFNFSRSELNRTYTDNPVGQVAAVAEGFGFDVATVGEPGKDGELTLRLVKDVGIVGRILDQEGKAVPGAKVRVFDVLAYKGDDLGEELEDIRKGGLGTYSAKGWSGPLPGQSATVTTGDDGRFRLTGLGRERIVHLIVEGPAIQYTRIRVMTRAAETIDGPNPSRRLRVYGAVFDHLAESSRPLRGVVRDKETRKPVAGVQISSYATTHTTQTDKDGRYELLGYAKSQEYHVTATPGAGQPYFTASARFADAPGFTPLDADIQLVRGIPLSGRVTDKDTGKPIRGTRVEYYAVYPNPKAQDGPHESTATAGADGTFALVVLPGPGVLAVTAGAVPQDKYMSALITLQEMKAFYKNWANPGGNTEDFLIVAAGGNSMRGLVQENHHALVLIEPDEKADKLKRDVALQPARTLKGSVVGPDGKPVAGALVFGLTFHHFAHETLKTADFTVSGINPKRTRELLFTHKELGLGYHQEIRGDEAGPLAIKLQPLGSASGRLVDKDGLPVPGLVLNVNRSRMEGPGGVQVKTGKDGRFLAEGLVPGQKYDLLAANRARSGGLRQGVVVESGKDKDLGDLTIDLGK
jgi:RNA polymerase sigma factor (sigma-70 family)